MVLTDGPIKKVEDLKGKVIGTVAPGAAVDVAIRMMLKKHGLEDKRDFVMLEAPLPTMRAMLSEKKVDLAPFVPPFAFDPQLRQVAKPLFVNRDVAGVTQLLFWVARQSFIDKNRAAMVDFMEDTLRITAWYTDPKNHKEMAEIAGRITKQPPERFGWAFTEKDYYRAPGMVPNLEALQKNVAIIKELGFVKDDIDVKKQSDLSLIEEAGKRLK
jgi:NitT/TauT family transport system substrate-binding protein